MLISMAPVIYIPTRHIKIKEAKLYLRKPQFPRKKSAEFPLYPKNDKDNVVYKSFFNKK